MLVEFKGWNGNNVVINISYITHIIADKDDPKYSTIYLVGGQSVYIEETIEDVLSRIVVPSMQYENDSNTTLFS